MDTNYFVYFSATISMSIPLLCVAKYAAVFAIFFTMLYRIFKTFMHTKSLVIHIIEGFTVMEFNVISLNCVNKLNWHQETYDKHT